MPLMQIPLRILWVILISCSAYWPLVAAAYYTPKVDKLIYFQSNYSSYDYDSYPPSFFDKWESEGNFGRPWP